jgi:hypothetical protein
MQALRPFGWKPWIRQAFGWTVGMDGFVGKPVYVAELCGAIAQCVGGTQDKTLASSLVA